MKENPEKQNSGFFLQKISFIIFESEERFQLIFDKPKEVSEQLTSFYLISHVLQVLLALFYWILLFLSSIYLELFGIHPQ